MREDYAKSLCGYLAVTKLEEANVFWATRYIYRTKKETLKNHENKVNFFLHKKLSEKYPVRNQKKLESRKKDRTTSIQRKSQNRKNWQKNKSAAKKEALTEKVELIKASNFVVNISKKKYQTWLNGLYLKLVESQKADKEDLRFDLNKFIRKIAWKAYFKDQGVTDNMDNDIHKSLRVKSKNYPEYSTPLIEEVKLKLQAWEKKEVLDEDRHPA